MPTLVKNELNVYECAEARFEAAAAKLGLEVVCTTTCAIPTRKSRFTFP